MEIYIKNMVCPRCIMSVQEIFRRNSIEPEDVQLGKVTLREEKLPEELMSKIRLMLENYDFELIDDQKSKTVELIRTGVIEYIHNPEYQDNMNLSEYLQKKCLKEYSALSKLFAQVRGMTIERFCILQKVEYVKELLFYGELSVSEISDLLHYSSTAHLSAQFKSVTGMTPTRFRGMKDHPLSPIDTL